MLSLDFFHPAVAAWFARTFSAATEAQVHAWPRDSSGTRCPGGRTDGIGQDVGGVPRRHRSARQGGRGRARCRMRRGCWYVSPLKALSNDIHRNLEAPLAGIRRELAALNLPDVEIRTVVRTGDTTQTERARMRRRSPHIVVTTPEVAVCAARFAIGPRHAVDLPHRDRR